MTPRSPSPGPTQALHPVSLVGAFATAALVAVPFAVSPAPAAVSEPLPPLVMTEVPVAAPAGPAGLDPCVPGARLVRVEPSGRRAVLTHDLEAACDPALDPTAARLYFAGRQAAEAPWRVWELELGTGARRPVSPEGLDCRQPAPLPRGTGGSDPAAPAAPVVFTCGGDLYRSAGDGSTEAVERLSFSGGGLSAPHVLPDGRLLLRAERPGEPARLLTALPDGTWVVPFRDAPFPGLEAARPAGRDALLAAMPPPGTPADGATALFRLSVADPFAPPVPVGPAAGWELRDPEGLPGGSVLAAGRPEDAGPEAPFRVVRLGDSPAGATIAAPAPAGFHALQPVALVARPAPDPLPSIVKPELNTGYLVLFDAVRSDEPALAGLERSRVAAVRVFPGDEDPSSPAAVDVPPAGDGSVFLEVPADRPLGLALVDPDGGVLARTAHPLWVRPNERRACLGCHVSARYAPPNVRPLALLEKAVWIEWGTERRGPRSELEGVP